MAEGNQKAVPEEWREEWLRNGGSEEWLRNGVVVCVIHCLCLVVACASCIKTVTKLYAISRLVLCSDHIAWTDGRSERRGRSLQWVLGTTPVAHFSVSCCSSVWDRAPRFSVFSHKAASKAR